MPALLFGSISTIADTSELQRSAFNQAFEQHGLGWKWERDEYRGLLTGNGGRQRIADYANARGESVDAAAVHGTKSEIFRESLAAGLVSARPGVADTVAAAAGAGWQVGLVTTTAPENVDALFAALEATLPRDRFDIVLDTDAVTETKPEPAVYEVALQRLGLAATQCVAVEDNVGGLQSATQAGIMCLVFANENTVEHDFGDAERVTKIDFDSVSAALGS